MKIKNGTKLLFVGDSITDAGRDRNDKYSLSAFSRRVANYINNVDARVQVEVFNRGISGYESWRVLDHFDELVTSVKPDYVVLMIGVNDAWHNFQHSGEEAGTTAQQYAECVTKIIDGILGMGAKLLVMEPYITDLLNIREDMYIDLIAKITKLRHICLERDVEYIPLDGIFNAYEIEHKQSPTRDGVHPNDTGNVIIANEIIKRLEIEA